MKSNEQGVPYNRYQPLCRRGPAWFHGLTSVSSLVAAGSGVCTLTFVEEFKTMTNTDIKILQASMDQLQKQLNATYTHMLGDSIPDDAKRKELKLKTSMEWTATYAEAKRKAASDE